MRTMPAEMTWASLLGAAGASLIRLHSLLPLRVAARRVEGNLRTQRAGAPFIVAEWSRFSPAQSGTRRPEDSEAARAALGFSFKNRPGSEESAFIPPRWLTALVCVFVSHL